MSGNKFTTYLRGDNINGVRKAILIPVLIITLILSCVILYRNESSTEYETSGSFGLAVSLVVLLSGYVVIEGIHWFIRKPAQAVPGEGTPAMTNTQT
jgi:hypothetical protein